MPELIATLEIVRKADTSSSSNCTQDRSGESLTTSKRQKLTPALQHQYLYTITGGFLRRLHVPSKTSEYFSVYDFLLVFYIE